MKQELSSNRTLPTTHHSKGFSKPLFIFGLLFIALAAGLYFWGAGVAENQSDPKELMTRIGQIAGGLGGLGAVLFLISLFKKGKSKQE